MLSLTWPFTTGEIKKKITEIKNWMWSLIVSTSAWRILKDPIWLIRAAESRGASPSELFFFETFTKKDAVFQSRNLISATESQLISRRCSSEAFVNISADAACRHRHRRTSISARPRWPPRRSAAGTLIKAAQPRRADGNGGERNEPLISPSEASAC